MGNIIGSTSYFREQVCFYSRLLSSELDGTELLGGGLTNYKYYNMGMRDTEALPHLLGAQTSQGRGSAE